MPRRDEAPSWVTGKAEERPMVRDCKVNGCDGSLSEQGFCSAADGYAEGVAHPAEVCGVCRSILTWDGKCYTCWNEGRRDVLPGHAYELQKGHWVVVARGPRSLGYCGVAGCTMGPQEHAREGIRAIRQMLAAVVPEGARS